MKKIEMEIVALSHSITQSHSYSVVLSEVSGVRRLPIVIGGFEAQAIAVALEKMNSSRPLTHDLMKNIFNAYDIDLKEIIINNLVEGIFYAQLICQQGPDTLEIDSRTSDAIALAVRFDCPIYTYDFILDSAGISMDENIAQQHLPVTEKKTETKQSGTDIMDLSKHSLQELNEILQQYLEREDYERAIAVRDEISKRKKES